MYESLSLEQCIYIILVVHIYYILYIYSLGLMIMLRLHTPRYFSYMVWCIQYLAMWKSCQLYCGVSWRLSCHFRLAWWIHTVTLWKKILKAILYIMLRFSDYLYHKERIRTKKSNIITHRETPCMCIFMHHKGYLSKWILLVKGTFFWICAVVDKVYS